jgi:hypothetical protein
MKKLLIATAILMTGAGIAAAQSDLPAGAKKDMPGGTGGGMTADPTAKPNSMETSQPSDKTQEDAPGTKGGMTADPNAKPKSSDLPSGAADKMPATDK